MPRAEAGLPLRQAVALGLLQGPTELLPVSSSGHTTLLPWLAGWSYPELDGGTRKSFELALHAGAGLALAADTHGDLLRTAARMDARTAGVLALSIAPAALTGAVLRGPIERRLGSPRSIAAGMLFGGLAMGIADRRPAAGRSCAEARAGDGLALGLAQALALMPGVSRSGATLTAARARGFGRMGAHALSWRIAVPVILGASLSEAPRPGRVRARGDRAAAPAQVAGGVCAFASTLLSARATRRAGVGGRSLLPYAIYRCLLAALVLSRPRRAQ